MRDVEAALRCGSIVSKHPPGEEEANWIPLKTGSVAEFYVEPILTHVGDIDVMCYLSNKLAIPRGYAPPTQLPAEFHNSVEVFQIIKTRLPGMYA